VQGTREGGDRDDVAGPLVANGGPGDLQALHTRRHLSTETFGSTTEEARTARKPAQGTRHVMTRIVRKTTTLTRGEEQSMANSLVKRGQQKAVLQVSETVLVSPPKRVKVGLRPKGWS